MTKKKRGHPDVEEVLSRPWCYYCERDFDDLKILINHQKAKHFKCERCGRRLNTAGGLSVHMSQVHKENLTAVDNALPNRAGLDIEIFGMEGIPEDISNQHIQRVLTNYHQAEAERRATTGNSASGVGGGAANKKPKFESPADLKKRLAEHKAKLADQANGSGSGSGTPVGAGQTAQAPSSQQEASVSSSQHVTSSASLFSQHAGSPQYPQYQQPYSAPPPPASMPYNQPASYAPSPVQASPFQQQPSIGYPPQPSFSPQPYQGQPPYQSQPPYQNQPPYQPQPSYQPQPPYQTQPPYQPQPPYQSQPPYQNQPPYQSQPYPNQAFSPPVMQNGPPQWQGPPGGPPRPYGAPSPSQPYPQQPYQPQSNHTPPQNGAFPQRTGSGSLPAAPGLPQRPAFGAPQANAFDFQRMHNGQNHGPANPLVPLQQPPPQNGQVNHFPQQPQSQPQPPALAIGTAPEAPQGSPTDATSLDDLISSASKQADATAAPHPSQAAPPTRPPVEPPTKEETTEDKATKKEKDKPKATRMIYSDNEISPEEKMARMARYAYTPDKKSIMV